VINRDRLRIAAQKNGRLSDPARDLMSRAGLSFRESRDRLFCFGETQPVDLLLVRDDDIPGPDCRRHLRSRDCRSQCAG
jgi:ATP phosphoribosyltransferase